jgi:hypothetical protein
MDRREVMTAGLAVALTATVASAGAAKAADLGAYGLKRGQPDIKSLGPIAFGPPGVLFVADPANAKIFALGVGAGRAAKAQPVDIDKLDSRLAAFLGASPADISVKDVAVQPGSNTVFLSVMRGSGAAATPALVKVGADGVFSQVSLKSLPYAETDVEKAPGADDKRMAVRVLASGPPSTEVKLPGGQTIHIDREPLRSVTVTDLAYVNGTLLVAGASNEEFSSAFRRISFPFNGAHQLNSLQIFHVSHGRYETASPITAFVPYGPEGAVLAAYTCTPLVQFSMSDAAPDSLVKGKSVADLGAVSTPIDMVAFRQGGQDYFLVSNSRHPLMRVARDDIDHQDGITQKGDLVGAARKALPQQGVTWMANLGDSHILMLQQDEAGALSLRSYAVESL